MTKDVEEGARGPVWSSPKRSRSCVQQGRAAGKGPFPLGTGGGGGCMSEGVGSTVGLVRVGEM